MSLDYDLSRMVDRDVHFPGEGKDGNELNAKVQSMIWLTIAVGINPITEKNYVEFFVRTEIWQKSVAPQFNRVTDSGFEPIWVTLEDVHHAVGLGTNASPKTKAQFLKDVHEAVEREALWRARNPETEVATEARFDKEKASD